MEEPLINLGFPGGTVVKNPSANSGDAGECVRSLGWEDPLEKEMASHSCLRNSLDRGAWWATVHEITKS